jgi:BirA family biotin operon repressor/biotin-[acetyl-CoA-carboxylase] ligase
MSMFTKEELQRGLRTRVIGKKVFVFESIDSTNTCAKTLAEADSEAGAVVIADHQTRGVGRHGRAWQSEPGANLLFSCILRPSVPQERAGLLTFYAAVAVARAAESVTGRQLECKWPNDLLLNGKKCCGILLENSFANGRLSYSVVGIGLNVNQPSFPDEMTHRATSLAREAGSEFDRKQLLQRILEELDALYPDASEGRFDRILAEWNDRCTMFGKEIEVENHESKLRGKAVRLNTDGGLVIETAEGRRVVYAGDVTLASITSST